MDISKEDRLFLNRVSVRLYGKANEWRRLLNGYLVHKRVQEMTLEGPKIVLKKMMHYPTLEEVTSMMIEKTRNIKGEKDAVTIDESLIGKSETADGAE
jgi:hypothetical protein